jgi:CHAT domain-containing protein
MRRYRLHPIALFILFVLCISIAIAAPSRAISPTPKLAESVRLEPGQASYEAGDFDRAVQELQAAAADFAAAGDVLSQAAVWRNLSLVYQQLGQWNEARSAIDTALSLLQTQTASNTQIDLLAEALDVQGRLWRETGQAAAAIETWQRAAQLYQQIGNSDSAARSQINQAQALQDLGFYLRACDRLRDTLGLSASPSNSAAGEQQACSLTPEELQTSSHLPITDIHVWGLRSLGDVLRVIGQLEQSQQILQQSLAGAIALQRPQETAAAYLSLGNTAAAFAQNPATEPDRQRQLQQEALTAYQAAQNSPSIAQQVQAQLNQLHLLVESQQPAEALEIWRSLQPAFVRLPPNRSSAYASVNLAQNLLKLAPSEPQIVPDIESVLSQGNAQAIALGDVKLQAYIWGSWGKLYELQQQWDRAAAATAQALQLASPTHAPDIAYQLLWQLGRIERSQGQSEQAIAHYTQAVTSLQSLRKDLVAVNSDIQFSFREQVEPVYRQLVQLLLAGIDRLPEDIRQQHLQQSRATIEALQLAELDNFFQEACLTYKPQSIENIDPHAAVIYPILLDRRLEVVLSLPGQALQHYGTDLPPEQAKQVFTELRQALNPAFLPEEVLPPAQQLYDWLIRPAVSELERQEIETLVFVLDGFLRSLPMAVLHDGEQYLIERYSIALTPGLQLFESHSESLTGLNTLVAGLAQARQGFGALPGVQVEIEQVQTEVPSSEVLFDRAFTRGRFEQKMETAPFVVIHLATHGQFSSNADETFLLTWDDRINVKDLNRLLQGQTNQTTVETYPPIELLVLSACQTAKGDDRAALGLAGVAVRSGARSTLATLWSVQDRSTAELITHFYRALTQPSTSKAEALRQAQLSLLRSSQYKHPYYWSPFVLVGNWQ